MITAEQRMTNLQARLEALQTQVTNLSRARPVPGQLIAAHQYGPASQVTYGAALTLAAGVFDSANATIKFTVPPSGNAIVEVGMDWAFGTSGTNSSAVDMYLGLVDHTTHTITYGQQSWCGSNEPNWTAGAHDVHKYYLAGLTPGPIQMDLAGAASTFTGLSFTSWYAQQANYAISTDPSGPLQIMVYAA